MLVGISPGPEHMSLNVDGVFVVRSNRENVNFVAVIDLEGFELLVGGIRFPASREIEREHGALLVRFNTLDFNVA